MSDNNRVVTVVFPLDSQKANEKVVKKRCNTVRIRVALPESNEDKCPEYNYKDELAAAKKKLKHNKEQQQKEEVNNVPNGLDPFGEDNDDDVRRIALEMEAKYGSGMTGGAKRKRKLRQDDYADIGAGYDESDSFIDNTDGYDEIIPHNVTTARGGFYINSGALEFKADEEATSELSSSTSEEESENEETPNKSKRKKQDGDKPNISMQQAIKKKLFSTAKIQIKKRKLADQHKNTVKKQLREQRTDSGNTDILKDILKENKKPMRLSSVVAAIDSVIGRTEETQKLPERNESRVEQQRIVTENKHDYQRTLEPEVATTETTKAEFVKLPENLPADILDVIENIKQAAKEYKDGGKVKFFSGEVNIMLLSLERKCKVLGRSSRVRVYEHLAPYVRCRKETLVKRAKNLVVEEECKKLAKTIRNLKSQIDQLMPALITNYEKECQRVLHKKFSQEAVTNEELKNLKAPRRRFPLHEEMKRMMRDIVSFKKRCFLHEGKSKHALEDLLFEYLKKEILPLWPDGWMSMTVLKKFCTTMAIKTPDPKTAALTSGNSDKHSRKSTTSSTIINYNSENNLTITPVNLNDKIGEISNSSANGNSSSKPDTIVRVLLKDVMDKSYEPIQQVAVNPVEALADEVIKTLRKERSDRLQEAKDNGVLVLNSKTKEDAVIPKETHCQIIDLTDTPVKSSHAVEDNSRTYHVPRERSPNFETTLKTKFPALSVTPANSHSNDVEDAQKVVESLKALHKLSSPTKCEVSSPVSVIAYNKNFSNSNSGQSSGVNNDRTNFSGALGFQDEFQKQFVSSFNHKPTSSAPPSKPGYNRCS